MLFLCFPKNKEKISQASSFSQSAPMKLKIQWKDETNRTSFNCEFLIEFSDLIQLIRIFHRIYMRISIQFSINFANIQSSYNRTGYGDVT